MAPEVFVFNKSKRPGKEGNNSLLNKPVLKVLEPSPRKRMPVSDGRKFVPME